MSTPLSLSLVMPTDYRSVTNRSRTGRYRLTIARIVLDGQRMRFNVG